MKRKNILFIVFIQFVISTVLLLYFELIPGYNHELVQQKNSCGRYPTQEDVIIDNLHWQILYHSKGLISILNAYLDTRQNKKVVRLNVNSKFINNSDSFFCQFWDDNTKTAEIVKMSDVFLAHPGGCTDPAAKYAFMIECPFYKVVPTSVSLVEHRCDHSINKLKIINVQPADGVRKRFGVCSKRMRFDNRDFGIRMIEWTHMVRLLGAEKIHFSYEYVHPDIFKIINYYQEKGIFEAWENLNPTGIEKSEHQLQVNTQTDCFYKVKNLYDFVAVIDLDELIMPVMEEDMTWDDIIRRTNVTEHRDAFISRNFYFLPETGAKPIEEIPKYMYMLQHVQRTTDSCGRLGEKSLVSTKRVLAVYTHTPYFCINDDPKFYGCDRHIISTNISQNSHYREIIPIEFNITLEDKTVWKYKDRLMEEVLKTLKDLDYAP